MNFFGLNVSWQKKAESISLDTLLRRLEAAYATASGISVTPENCMESPTVNAIVTGISRRIESLPVHVFQKVERFGRPAVERLPSHPVERLLAKFNDWQSVASYWLDSTSSLVRYGNYYAYKARGVTGPIRRLEPLPADATDVTQNDDLSITYRARLANGKTRDFESWEIHHVRGPARNYVKGDSPVVDAREAIALEIAAQRMGAAVFGNGAMPGLVFEFMDNFAGFRTEEERRQFVDDFNDAYTKKDRFKSMILPRGLKLGSQIAIENEKAQFLETRKMQRSVIAGAFGVPAHMVGDLERATFSNIEHQSLEFVQTVVLPYVRMYETAMERDLLTDDDRRSGVIIRFNLDGALRGDFKSRQEGLKIQREMGVIGPDDWREIENMNPLGPSKGGDNYWQQGPSGQGQQAAKPVAEGTQQ